MSEVWIASYPRSGNKFARTVLRMVYGVPSRTIYEKPAFRHTKTWLPESTAAVGDAAAGAFHTTQFIKTHELPTTDDRRAAIYVLRDGRDAYVSYAHYYLRKTGTEPTSAAFEPALRMLVESKEHFGGWSTHVEQWMSRDAQTAVVRYEEISADPAGALARACRSIGLEPPPPVGVMPSFEEMRALAPKSVRKGKVGGWRDEMSPELEELFWCRHGATMERLGYAR